MGTVQSFPGSQVQTDRIEACKQFLELAIPEVNWASEHVQRTPERFLSMLRELTSPDEDHFELTTFPNDMNVDEMVIVQDIPFHSLCAHHIVPFYGHAHIAYIPEERIAGLSKFARTVKYMSKGLWTQEELSTSISEFLQEHLQPKGVAVVIQAEHLCMTIRGVQSPGTITTTSSMKGVFLDPARSARHEFLALIQPRH